MKHFPKLFAKFFYTIRINSSSIISRPSYSNENVWTRRNNVSNTKRRNGGYIKFLEESALLIKSASAIKNESKEQKVGCLCMLLATLDSSLLGNPLINKDVYAGDVIIRLLKE